MKEREMKILKNSLVFTIGNLGSKVLSYIMVLVYTHYISLSELGYYDIVLTSISFLQPFVMLAFDEGIYRWLIDANKTEQKSIISSCIKAIGFTTLIASIFFLLVNQFICIKYGIEIIILFSSGIIYSLLLNAARGLGSNELYAKSGIINSILMLLFEIVGIVLLKKGVVVLIVSKSIANIITCIYIYFKQNEIKGFVFEKININIAKSILKYTLPLIPNTVSWWIVSSSDRYIILFGLGTTFNGIYAIANKFPTIITMVASILYLALQEAVIKAYNEEDRDAFYSNIFEKYYKFLFSLVMCAVPITKIIIMFFVGTAYTSAWKYVGFLFMSTVFSSLSSFLGIGYQVSKDTKRSAISTIFAAIINIIVNVLLINFIGLHAASLSTLCAYVFLFVIRIIHSKKYFSLYINWKKFVFLFVECLVIIGLTFICNIYVILVIFIVAVVLFLYNNKDTIVPIIKKLFNKKSNV